MDKLAKENKDVQYLFVAVNCLSRYLRVEPLESKYATTTADALKKIIKNKQPKKVWVDAGTEFNGSFSTICRKSEIEVHKKSCICGKKYTIAKELDLHVIREQLDILVYKSTAEICSNH